MTKIDLRKISDKRTLQFGILKRFMSDEDIKRLMEGYAVNSRRGLYENRQVGLGEPLNALERSVLKRYLFEEEKSIREICLEVGVRSQWGFISKCGRAALKIVYQNRDKVDLEELLK
ncbi:MAG: hypothetical protein A2V69_01115 [Candidatus Portnoybacteria bacterium RBG_13_40_8]|uniref:Uncharacterized protein n=1 Tax=Candidatus Portnoybacteria bacterium RBG_13_40_8 TaxID=1801990 RepID=A0A1G2F2N7_9BACT|nr:MAG: hypothetical protein A2V69_01115 [Candidatus Portnoybacteria bacterium RBG_13_40_8]